MSECVCEHLRAVEVLLVDVRDVLFEGVDATTHAGLGGLDLRPEGRCVCVCGGVCVCVCVWRDACEREEGCVCTKVVVVRESRGDSGGGVFV